MRYRDFCCIAIVMLLVIFASGKASQTLRDLSFASVEINREDANRESSTILSRDSWVEYQIQNDANSLRLLTNVALDARDAPDHDLHNPRTGWRYAVDYELLDADRNVFQQATYHFRSQVHQLLDVASGEPIYPIFFGKSSLVATQTRAMQLPINRGDQKAAILRVRVAKTDAEIQEVVARVLVRSEREDYDRRTTWNRMSQVRREALSRFCVYDHDLLTISERNNLLRLQWKSAPVISEFKKRYLFFIGDIDDQQVRGDQLPAGLYIDANWLGTIPVPESSQNVRLEFRWIDPVDELSRATAAILWTGAEITDRTESFHTASESETQMQVTTDGGLIQISADRAVVVRAFVDASDLTLSDSPAGRHFAIDAMTGEAEITPEMNFIRTFLSDSRPIHYGITHLGHQATPMRLVVRYPYAPLFSNLGATIGKTRDSEGTALTDISARDISPTVHATWQFIRSDGSLSQQGDLALTPVVSAYDRFTVAGQREPISDPSEFHLAVPPDVAEVRVHSPDSRLLVSAYVRDQNLPAVTKVPEDYHAFNRTTSTRRTWHGIKPIDHESMIQDNRSFIVQSQSRPAQPNEEVLAGRYEWERFLPAGNWVARQLLVRRELETRVRQSAIGSSYYELRADETYRFTAHAAEQFVGNNDVRLAFVSDDHPGAVTVIVNGKVVHQETARSSRGEISLADILLPSDGEIEIRAQHPARFFVVGKEIANANPFLKRSAQRLKEGVLDFQYQKLTHDEELLTLQLFRSADDSARCRIQIDIESIANPPSESAAFASPNQTITASPSWTVRRRQYDLRPQSGHDSILLGHTDRVDAGYRCFVRLGDDLPPGAYRIRVQRLDQASARSDRQTGQHGGYAMLYKIVAGQRPRRMLQIDSELGDDDGN